LDSGKLIAIIAIRAATLKGFFIGEISFTLFHLSQKNMDDSYSEEPPEWIALG
jgi:uncharacterized protein YneF (UPF0154 family)